ncbi:hypothetical protein WJX74_004996 [Apatococcus lobatus]|uniref:Uncharacterized protein n=1 Tax=Apatococcus lobatus TaxID=904363 RepID=A0AAW1R1Q8_9CHLO
MVHTRRSRSAAAPASTNVPSAEVREPATSSAQQVGSEKAAAAAARPKYLERKPLAAGKLVQGSAAAQAPAGCSNTCGTSALDQMQQPVHPEGASNLNKQRAQVDQKTSSKRSKRRASSSRHADPELQPEATLPAKRARLDQASRKQQNGTNSCSADALMSQQAHATDDLDLYQSIKVTSHNKEHKHKSAHHRMQHDMDGQCNDAPTMKLQVAPHALQQQCSVLHADPREQRRKRRSAKHEAAENAAPGSQQEHITAGSAAKPEYPKQSKQEAAGNVENDAPSSQRKQNQHGKADAREQPPARQARQQAAAENAAPLDQQDEHEKADAREQQRKRLSEADATLPDMPTSSDVDVKRRRRSKEKGSQQAGSRHQQSLITDQADRAHEANAVSDPAGPVQEPAEAAAVAQLDISSASVKPTRRHRRPTQLAATQPEAKSASRPPAELGEGSSSQGLRQPQISAAAAERPTKPSSNPAKKSSEAKSASRRRSSGQSMDLENAASQGHPQKAAYKASQHAEPAPVSPLVSSPLNKQRHSPKSPVPRQSLQDVTNSPLPAMRTSLPNPATQAAPTGRSPSSDNKLGGLPLARQLIPAALPSPQKGLHAARKPEVTKQTSPGSHHRPSEPPHVALQPLPNKVRQSDHHMIPQQSGNKHPLPPGPKECAGRQGIGVDVARVPERPVLPATALQPSSLGDNAAWFNALDAVKVNAVKAVLRPGQAGGQHGAPLCREGHFQQLMQFLTAAHGKDQGSSAYVTGLPGTGKSVTVHATARQWNEQICKGKSGSAITPRLISINCMSLTQPREVLARILEGVQAQPLPRCSSVAYQGAASKASRSNQATADNPASANTAPARHSGNSLTQPDAQGRGTAALG